jgi:hypothetical protein
MSSRLNRLLQNYQKHISVPWQTGLAGAQKVIFAVYDKTDELRFRTHLTEFEIETCNAKHDWYEIDISNAFPEWMANIDYKEGYFESPEDIETTLDDFMEVLVNKIKTQVETTSANTVIAIVGVGALFGYIKASDLVSKIAPSVPGRLLIFFPGEFENNNYRLLDARDGWNYQAVPITVSK